jgi:hypothetical protein
MNVQGAFPMADYAQDRDRTGIFSLAGCGDRKVPYAVAPIRCATRYAPSVDFSMAFTAIWT